MLTLDDLRVSQCAVITVKDAAALLGVDRRTVTGALSVHGGDIPARRVGRRVVIPRMPFLEWLDGSTIAPTVTMPATDPAPDAAALVRAKLIELLGALEDASPR